MSVVSVLRREQLAACPTVSSQHSVMIGSTVWQSRHTTAMTVPCMYTVPTDHRDKDDAQKMSLRRVSEVCCFSSVARLLSSNNLLPPKIVTTTEGATHKGKTVVVSWSKFAGEQSCTIFTHTHWQTKIWCTKAIIGQSHCVIMMF
jgi:hypothetical protein